MKITVDQFPDIVFILPLLTVEDAKTSCLNFPFLWDVWLYP